MVFTEDLYGADTQNYYGDGISSFLKKGVTNGRRFLQTDMGQALAQQGKNLAVEQIKKKDRGGYLAGII
jgi:TolB-like protein